jgi:hypothetical protein
MEKRIYANQVSIDTSVFDFIFSFGSLMPKKEDDGKAIIPYELDQALIFMSPQHAKAFSKILEEQLKHYENTFGEINLDPIKKQSTE